MLYIMNNKKNFITFMKQQLWTFLAQDYKLIICFCIMGNGYMGTAPLPPMDRHDWKRYLLETLLAAGIKF